MSGGAGFASLFFSVETLDVFIVIFDAVADNVGQRRPYG